MQGLEASRRGIHLRQRQRAIQRLLLEGARLTNVISSHSSHPMKKTAISTKKGIRQLSRAGNSLHQAGDVDAVKKAGISSRLP
jgi:hypothetical protein